MDGISSSCTLGPGDLGGGGYATGCKEGEPGRELAGIGERRGFGVRGAMIPSDVFLREDRSLGTLPSNEKMENIDRMREIRGVPV